MIPLALDEVAELVQRRRESDDPADRLAAALALADMVPALTDECRRHRDAVPQSDRDVLQALLDGASIPGTIEGARDWLATRSGWDRQTVGRALVRLEALGVIDRRQRPYRVRAEALALVPWGPRIAGHPPRPPRRRAHVVAWLVDGSVVLLEWLARRGLWVDEAGDAPTVSEWMSLSWDLSCPR